MTPPALNAAALRRSSDSVDINSYRDQQRPYPCPLNTQISAMKGFETGALLSSAVLLAKWRVDHEGCCETRGACGLGASAIHMSRDLQLGARSVSFLTIASRCALQYVGAIYISTFLCFTVCGFCCGTL